MIVSGWGEARTILVLGAVWCVLFAVVAPTTITWAQSELGTETADPTERTPIETLPTVSENALGDTDAIIDEKTIDEFNTMVVTATRKKKSLIDTPASIAVQDVGELRRNGLTVGTDEFRGVTGVFFRRGEGGADEFPWVSFRGSTGTEGAISLIDGIPFIGLFEELQLNEIPYDAIERVEVVKGPVSALYGRGALYGATNYITRNPHENAVVTRFAGGSDSFYRASASVERMLGENGGLFLAGAYQNYDGWREHSQREIFNMFAKARYDFTPHTTLTIYGNYNDRDVELANGRVLGSEGEILAFAGGNEGFIGFGNPNNEIENIFTAMTLEHRVSDDLVFAFKGSYRNIQQDAFLNFFDRFGRNLAAGIVGYNGLQSDTSQDVFYGEATARWRTRRHDIIAGVTVEQSNTEVLNLWTGQNGFTAACGFTFYSIQVDISSGNVLNENNPCFARNDLLTDSEFDNTFWGIFVQDEISLTDRLRLTLGLRYDDFSRKATFASIAGVTAGGRQSGNADAFSPKASLSYLTDWGQVYVAYGRGFNSNFGATFEWDPVQYARPEQRPTKIDSVEMGVKGNILDNRLSAEAIIFYSEQRNRRQIVDNPAAASDFSQPSNLIAYGDRYRSRGLEFSLNAAPTDTTKLRLNYTYLDPEWEKFKIKTSSGTMDFSGNTPVGVPSHLLYLQTDQQITEWLTLRGILEYYSDYFYTDDNAFKDGGYTIVTFAARLEPEFLKGFTLDLTLNNAFDATYYSFFGGRTDPRYAMPGPPRQFRVALTKRF
ncbi:MAG: TonB-dependent receptor [Gammaproteobacteria bacterium]|nr:TonB-dependent receptor [Gammaproteobacteria bacterium]